MDTFYADIVSHLLQVLASTMTVSDVSTVLCLVLLFRLCGVRQPPQTDLECLGPLFRVNVFTLDQYIDIFTTPLLDDTLNFVVQTCLISERSWVDWDLVGQTRGNLFRCWLAFCRGRTPNTVLTAALLVLSRRLLRSWSKGPLRQPDARNGMSVRPAASLGIE